ncbi:MAG: ABC transporter permease, partial [Polyangia bacterium]
MKSYPHSIRENLWLALDTLRTHKFRSFLTVLGVLLGTTTVILVASLIQGLDKQLADAASSIGNRTITVYKLPLLDFNPTREERLRKPLTYEDGEAVRSECADVDMVGVEIINWV